MMTCPQGSEGIFRPKVGSWSSVSAVLDEEEEPA